MQHTSVYYRIFSESRVAPNKAQERQFPKTLPLTGPRVFGQAPEVLVEKHKQKLGMFFPNSRFTGNT